ncbi:IS3 family transposase [Shewanella algae]|uniref:IS3 family transposase n=1 Tax=Shewanella algae TaxID=38313 RepID=UPI001AACA479|nr:IS3 family transposase [Shewanella algae]MBO2692926.1 IS3 family transposase [Shewanella algae]QTE89573.1 IS3 family transposase [Shewanella algae]QTE89863.1 IS3 family transposase [Shewanella algae]QTE89978.1 IS3 family transposase [Shewanella algae]
MKKRYTEEQIIKAIKQHEAGAKVDDICREMGISTGTFYNWRSKYAGLEVNEAKRLRELEAENNKLKKMLADKMLEVEAMKDVLFKKVVTPAAKKPVAQHLIEGFSLSERVACKLAGLSRTAFRYQPRKKPDNGLRQRLKALATQYPRYGYLMLHGLLRGEGWVKNRKRTYRLYTEEGLQVRTKKRKKLTRPRQPMEVPTAPNQRWSMDFVSDQLSNGRRFRVLNVVDDYSREMVGQLVSVAISGRQVARFLDQLMEERGKPKKVTCDNGTEFTSKAMFFWSKETGVTLGFIQPGKPTQNAFVESLNGKFRNECLNQHWFRTLDEARYEIELWREHYNHVRPHSSLNYMPPVAYAKQAA